MQSPQILSGTVIHGNHLGSKLGFPTANLALSSDTLLADGVYAVRVTVGGSVYNGVANIGTRPTVTDNPERFLEAYLFGFDGDLYGQTIDVELVEYLRPEKKFGSLDELKREIEQDKTEAEKILSSCI